MHAQVALLTPDQDRFLQYVNVKGYDECWPWIGKSLHTYGYGSFQMKRPNGKWSGVGSHRAAWRLFQRELPPGVHVLHGCDNVLCCNWTNPKHLHEGTHKDNMRERRERGTHGYTKATHCKNGHAWDLENTCILSNDWKRCRACRRESMR